MRERSLSTQLLRPDMNNLKPRQRRLDSAKHGGTSASVFTQQNPFVRNEVVPDQWHRMAAVGADSGQRQQSTLNVERCVAATVAETVENEVVRDPARQDARLHVTTISRRSDSHVLPVDLDHPYSAGHASFTNRALGSLSLERCVLCSQSRLCPY